MRRRNRHKQENSYTQKGRDYKTIARLDSLPLSKKKSLFLSEIEDRRRYHPLGRDTYPQSVKYRKATDLIARGRKVQSSHQTNNFATTMFDQDVPQRLGFRIPDQVAVCIRRKIRRQVIHAFDIAGRRGLSGPKYNNYSKIRC